MEQQSGSARKTCTYQLLPTTAQEQTLETDVWRCRELYNAGLQERTVAWERCRVSATCAMRTGRPLPAGLSRRAAMPT
jgi:hypothetical protein